MMVARSGRTGGAPRLTIGLPVYNSADYLPQALDSLLAQSFGDFELVISDNASTDATETICRDYAARDSRIRYVRESENRGASWNFNRVFQLATGEYFKWAAHDDYCAPTFLERCINVLDADPSVVCCHTKTQKVDARGDPLPLNDPTEGGNRGHSGHRARNASSRYAHSRFRDVLLSSGWAVRCYGVMRAAALQQTGLLLPVYGYEKIMMAELSLVGRFHVVPDTLFYQRVHTESSSHLATAAEQQSFFAAKSVERSFPRLEYLRGYVRALHRVPISRTDRMLAFVSIIRYLLQVSKWKSVIVSSLRGAGTGGAARGAIADADGSPEYAASAPDPVT